MAGQRSDRTPSETGLLQPEGAGSAGAVAQEGPLTAACPPMPATRAADAASDVPDFDTLYREQRGRVLGAVRAVLGPSDEIEDVVQLAFLEVHRCLPRFEGRSRLSTWIYRIAVNVALQHIRRKKRRRWLMLGATAEDVHRHPDGTDTGLRLEDRQMLERVYAAAATLSEKKRTVWVLHELQGLDPTEIAEIVEVPMNTVRSRLLAARREIKEELVRQGVLGGDEA